MHYYNTCIEGEWRNRKDWKNSETRWTLDGLRAYAIFSLKRNLNSWKKEKKIVIQNRRLLDLHNYK